MMYKLKNKVMTQKYYEIGDDESVLEYVIKHKNSLDPADTFIVAGVNGTLYEFNMIAAITLEELLKRSSHAEVAEALISVFYIDDTRALKTVEFTAKELLSKGVIEKINL